MCSFLKNIGLACAPPACDSHLRGTSENAVPTLFSLRALYYLNENCGNISSFIPRNKLLENLDF